MREEVREKYGKCGGVGKCEGRCVKVCWGVEEGVRSVLGCKKE